MVSLPVPTKESSQQWLASLGPWRSEAILEAEGRVKALPAEKTIWPKAWRREWTLDTSTLSCKQTHRFRSLPVSDVLGP